MPISMTIAVTTLLGVLAAAQHIYNLPDTSAKAAKQAEKQARYDAKHQQFLRDLEVERQAKNYSARDFSNRQYEVTPEPEISPTITTQPGFSVEIRTPAPASPSYSAREIGNRLGEAEPYYEVIYSPSSPEHPFGLQQINITIPQKEADYEDDTEDSSDDTDGNSDDTSAAD